MTALMSALGDKYRFYASHHKRLIPLVWQPCDRLSIPPGAWCSYSSTDGGVGWSGVFPGRCCSK